MRRRQSGQPIGRNSLSLDEVGLTATARAVIFVLSLFPFLGLLVSAYYSAQGHSLTRSFGRTLLSVTIVLHTVYICVICPFLLWIGLGEIF